MKIVPLILSVLLCGIFTQCSSNIPLAAGTMQAEDPVATSLFNDAVSLRNSGKSSKARKKLEELVKNHSLATEAPEALLYIGDIYLEEKEPVDAFEAYDKMLKTYPNSPLYSTGMQKLEDLAFGVADGTFRYDLLWFFESSVDTRRTIEMLTSVRDNAPYAPSASRALLKIGQVYDKVGYRDQAIVSYHKVVDDYPNSASAPYAQYAIANNYLKWIEEGSKNTSYLKSAQEAYEDFLHRYPKHELAQKSREELGIVRYKLAANNLDIGRFYLSTGNQPSAIFYFQEAAHDQYNEEVRAEAKKELDKLGVSLQKPQRR